MSCVATQPFRNAYLRTVSNFHKIDWRSCVTPQWGVWTPRRIVTHHCQPPILYQMTAAMLLSRPNCQCLVSDHATILGGPSVADTVSSLNKYWMCSTPSMLQAYSRRSPLPPTQLPQPSRPPLTLLWRPWWRCRFSDIAKLTLWSSFITVPTATVVPPTQHDNNNKQKLRLRIQFRHGIWPSPATKHIFRGSGLL